MTEEDTNKSADVQTVFSKPVAMLTLGGLFAANAVSLDGPVVSIPEIAAQFGISSGQAQMVTVLFLLGFALGHIPMGLLGDRFGRKPVIIAGLTIAGVMSVITVIATSFEVMLAARFCQGVATCAASMLARAMVRDVASGAQASKLNSKALSFLALFIVIAPLLSGVLLEVSGWRSVMGLVSAYIVSLLLLTLFFVPETMHTEKHTAHPWRQFLFSLKSFFETRQSIMAALLGAIAFSTYFIFVNIGSSMIVDVYGLPASRFALIFAFCAVFQLCASMLNTYLVGKRGPAFVLRLAKWVCLGAIVISFYGLILGRPPLALIVLIALCFSVTHGLVLPNSIALALDPLPKTAGFASAIQGMMQTGLAAIVGFVASGFYDGQIKTVLLLFAVFGGLTLTVFISSRKTFGATPKL